MKKKLFALLFAFVLSLSCAVPAFAATASHSRVADRAELLTDDEISALSDMLDEISSRQQMDVVVMTSDDLQGYDTATECADELYEYCGYGFGDEKDGIMLFISMDDRDWAISTCGRAIDVFSENDCDYIGDEIVPYLSDGDYAAAFERFAELCDRIITSGGVDDDYDYDDGDYRDFTIPSERLSPVWILVSIVAGILIAVLIVGIMRSKLKTVRFQAAASNYVKHGSMQITDRSDLFLYRTMSRTPRPKNNDNSSSGGIHMSSSGTMHGGSSGKF